MSLFSQALLDMHDELIVDCFAGGGGASCGIEWATGRMVDIAINHDAKAVSMHQANHPQTQHLISDVFEVDPRQVTQGRKVGLLWASPDCTYHSKARGAKPLRDKGRKRRALAWVVSRWAGQVRPRVIALENVEEFAMWGPLVGPSNSLRPCKKRRGRTFKAWVRSLTDLGYEVEWRELRACDYGAPTIRKRLFVIARCDGKPIVWPAQTHAEQKVAKARGLKPWVAAATCIDWSIPMCSIFATKEEAKAWADFYGVPSPIRPLAENTMRRIARGVDKFVLSNPKPYLVNVAHGEGSGKNKRWNDGSFDIAKPLSTVTCKGESALVCPVIAGVGGRAGQSPERSGEMPLGTITAKGDAAVVASHLGTYYGESDRFAPVDEPLRTQSTANRFALASAFLTQNNGGFFDGEGKDVTEPLSTILANSRGHHGLMTAHMQRDFGTSTGSDLKNPAGTITTEGNGKCAVVGTFMSKYYGTGDGQEVGGPSHTITSKDRFSLVTVKIHGVPKVIADIAMRMLTPRELFLCQGFPSTYIIDRGFDGTPLTKTEQVRMCGNSVSPMVAKAIVEANCPDLIVRQTQQRKAS